MQDKPKAGDRDFSRFNEKLVFTKDIKKTGNYTILGNDFKFEKGDCVYFELIVFKKDEDND